MSLEDFQFLDIEATDNSITEGDFLKVYLQKAANLTDSDQKIELIPGENNDYHQIGNAYLQYKIAAEKDVANAAHRLPVDRDVIRLLSNAFAYCFTEARLSATGGSDIEHNKYIDQVSTITKALTNKNGIYYLILIKLMNLKIKSKINLLNIFLLTTATELVIKEK